MRGDSLRDLYAKGLAVLGLGLLAGTGALIDYWPSSIEIPRISRANGLSMPALARVLRADPALPQAVVPGRPAAPAARVDARSRRPALSFPEFRVAVSSQGLLLDGGVALDAVVTPFGVEPVSSVTSVGTEIALTVPSVQTHPAPEFDETAMAAPADEADPDGFLTEAVKKTGTSIVRTGVKTGASIRDAVRAIGGAVRRAFPG